MDKRILAVAVVAALFVGMAARPLVSQAVGSPTARTSERQMRLDQFRALSRPHPVDVVLVGDSLIQRGEWGEWLGGRVANRGIGSNTTQDVLARIDAIPPAPTAVLMIGLNDLAAGDAPEEISSRTAQIVRRLDRRVVLMSVLPERGRNNANTLELNRLNRAWCKGRCSYVDLYPTLAPSGSLRRDVTGDGVHLNGTGYELWVSALRDYISPSSAARISTS